MLMLYLSSSVFELHFLHWSNHGLAPPSASTEIGMRFEPGVKGDFALNCYILSREYIECNGSITSKDCIVDRPPNTEVL